MAEYERVPLPTGAAYAPHPEMIAGMRRWVTAPPTRDLVGSFGGTLPDLETGELLSWLDRFSGEHWDFRARGGGVERDEVRGHTFPAPLAASVRAAVTALGLADPPPPSAVRYDHLLILGGLARSCLDRTNYAAHLVGDGTETGEVAALGSFRPLRPVETDGLGLDVGPGLDLDLDVRDGCRYEVDVMDLGVRSAFDVAEPHETRASTGAVDHHSWSARTYRPAGGPPVLVLAAPSSEPATRRAHTSDTYHYWAGRVRLTPEDRVLIVTCPIYVPFQHCDAIRTLGLTYGCAVETVGVDPAVLARSTVGDAAGGGAGGPARSWTTDRYLQEVRSAIRAMRNLHTAIQPR